LLLLTLRDMLRGAWMPSRVARSRWQRLRPCNGMAIRISMFLCGTAGAAGARDKTLTQKTEVCKPEAVYRPTFV